MMIYLKQLSWRLRLRALGKSIKLLNEVEHWQWFSGEQLVSLQNEHLKELLSHAYRHVPYYRDKLEQSGVVGSSDKVNLPDFHKIPLLDKSIIRSRFEDLKSDDLHSRNWQATTSGGSTGEPVRLIRDHVDLDWGSAVTMLFDLWSGYNQCENKTLLWGSERDLFIGRETLKINIGRWLQNQIWLNAFRMSTKEMLDHVERINAFRPVQILAYAESIYELSQLIERRGLSIHKPISIMTSAGTLHSHMRDTIERVFGTPVFNRYGSRELGNVACECDYHSGLHVSATTHYVEILRPDGTPTEPGEMGEIVVTPLHNHAMPLIRYRIGDRGMWAAQSCGCGRAWPLLAEVAGRVTDIFINKRGQRFDGRIFNTFFWDKPYIDKFQVIQEDYDQIRVLIKSNELTLNPNTQFRHEVEGTAAKIRRVLGQDCLVSYEYVHDIPPAASGKYLYTISKVCHYQNTANLATT